jgi:hypothetical protein
MEHSDLFCPTTLGCLCDCPECITCCGYFGSDRTQWQSYMTTLKEWRNGLCFCVDEVNLHRPSLGHTKGTGSICGGDDEQGASAT